MHSHLILQDWWSKTNAGILTQPSSDVEIAVLEHRYGVSLPDDFREYLRMGAPTVENWDAEDGNWWPTERIKNIPDEYPHPVGDVIAPNASRHLVFIDFSIWCWAWAISCAGDDTHGKVAIIGGGGSADGYVADSFTDFVQKYTTDWWSISQVQKPRSLNRFRVWISRI